MTRIDAPASQTTPIMAALAPMMHADQVQPASVEFTDKQGARGFGQVLWLSSMQAGIVYAIDEQRIFGPLTSLIPFTVAIFVAALAAMGGVLTLGAARVFGPLAALADNAQGFAEGDFSQRAVVRTKDEIGLLAESFNHMAEELSSLYRSLERRVEERTRQMRTAAAVAERITSTTNVRELLDRTARLLVEQFPFYQAGVFLLDRAARFAVLEASYGPAAEELLARGHRLEVGSASIIGWVSANNQPRIASDVAEDPFHLKKRTAAPNPFGDRDPDCGRWLGARRAGCAEHPAGCIWRRDGGYAADARKPTGGRHSEHGAGRSRARRTCRKSNAFKRPAPRSSMRTPARRRSRRRRACSAGPPTLPCCWSSRTTSLNSRDVATPATPSLCR